MLVCFLQSCYKEFDIQEADWSKDNAIITVNGSQVICSIRSVLEEERHCYNIYFDFYHNNLKYDGIILRLPTSSKKKKEGFNNYGGKVVCEKNCPVVYGMFEQYDIASTYYYFDTLEGNQYVALLETNKKEISVSFRMVLYRERDVNENTLNMGLSKIEIEGEVSNIPLRRARKNE